MIIFTFKIKNFLNEEVEYTLNYPYFCKIEYDSSGEKLT